MQPIRSRTLLLLFAACIVCGCAEERDPINRVQAGALSKAFFIGEDFQSVDDDPEFWTQNTLVDVGWGAAQGGLFTSSYVHPTSRVRWQLTEKLLLARAAHERVEGSDAKGIASGLETQDGVIVAAFAIESHFDIRREYNPSTGEEYNVITENTVDRAWYQREYFRVDWSANLATDSYDFDTLSILGVLHGIDYEPLSYYVADPHDEQAPFFDVAGGYFDITTKVFAKPKVVDVSAMGWGIDSLPACFLNFDTFEGSYPEGNCSPVELTVRHAFRRVVDNDYAPKEWDGWRFQAYGGFTVERFGYARNYGMTDALHHRLLTRYPIWERHHFYAKEWKDGQWQGADGPPGDDFVACYVNPDRAAHLADPHRDDDGDGTDDECAAVTEATGFGGSKCNTFRQRCTLPKRARKSVTIAWYYTNGHEMRFFDATADATHQWDVALRTAVRTSRYVECMSTGGERASCAEAYPMYVGQQSDNADAIALGAEMDDCRRQRTFLDLGGEPQACAEKIAEIASQRGYRHGVRSIATMEEMIVLCHSPVQADDPPACGAAEKRLPPNISAEDCAAARAAEDIELLTTCRAALTVRRGDLRYHQVNAIEIPQTPSPWGIYTDAEDPLSGETIAASINVFTWYNDYWAQQVVDRMRFAAGELEASDVTDGEHVHAWSAAAQAANDGAIFPKMTRAERNARLSEFAVGHRQADLDGAMKKLAAMPTAARNFLRSPVSGFTGVMASSQASSTSAATYDSRRQAAQGTPLEAALITPMMQDYFGVKGLPSNAATMDAVSPLRGGRPGLRHQIEALKRTILAKRGMCERSAAPAPLSVAGLGKLLEAKFGRFDAGESQAAQAERATRMVDYIARRAHRSVVQHEMGHSLGLRHNFLSSADALFYRPQYWQLRSKDGTVTESCHDLSETGEDCVGPRYFDPVTPNESANLIHMWQQSSVMDYAGDAAQEFLGVGAYDFAAVRMFYGDTVAVYADEPFKPGPIAPDGALPPYDYALGNSLLEKLDNFGGIVGMRYSDGVADFQHYSDLNRFYGLIRDCETVSSEAFRQTRYDEQRDGAWHPLLDAELVRSDDGSYRRCRQPPVDYVSWNELGTASDMDDNLYYRSRNLGGVSRQIDAQDRIRVPYGFASDDWADLGNVSVNLFDNGGDIYEIFNFLIAQEELFHIFNDFRRGRAWFSVRGAADTTFSRYSRKLRDGAKGLALQRNYVKSFFTELGWNFDEIWLPYSGLYFSDNVLAAAMTFDHFARSLARPQAGPHCMPHFEPVMRSMGDFAGCDQDNELLVNIPDGAFGTAFGEFAHGGRLVENRLDASQGEYEIQYTLNSGSYYDKALSAMLMTESVDNFISFSRSDYADKRYRAVSLADLFPDGYRRWLANNLTGDDFIKGARVAATEDNGGPEVDDSLSPTRGIGWTSWWGEQPTSCFPKDGTTVCSQYTFDYASLTLKRTDLNDAPAFVSVLDPQVGWEQQKFLIAWTLLYLPENEKQMWLDLLRIWELGKDADPQIQPRIELHLPHGKTYVARTFGRETIFGKQVQRGIAARMLEYANELMFRAYETTPIDNDNDTIVDWYRVVRNDDGEPIVRFDPTMTTPLPTDPPDTTEHIQPGCDPDDNSQCTCAANRACMALQDYAELPFFLRQTLDAYDLVDPQLQGFDGN
jgi:hypothetical protein